MKRTNRQGEVWTNNDRERLHIIEYNGVNDCTIEFEDGTDWGYNFIDHKILIHKI